MTIEFLDFLEPKKVEKSADDINNLGEAEKLYSLLNGYSKNFYFRFPTPADLRTITDKFKEEECFLRLVNGEKVDTILGNANGVLKIQTIVQATFNPHEFLKEKMLSRQYYLDLLKVPKYKDPKQDAEAVREFERTIRTNPFIRRKQHLLEDLGISYMIHYDANRLASQVIEDVKKTGG